MPNATESRFDFAVVGGGIVGLAVARELTRRHPGASICVLEREAELAAHQTSHSSGVIHSGIYYEPGSLKARLCVRGAAMLWDYCAEQGIDARRDGKLIVAVSPQEIPRLDELERRGRANGVPRLRRLTGDQIAGVEPHATGVAALHSPSTGVTDFAAVARALAAEVSAAGGVIRTGAEVTGINAVDGRARIRVLGERFGGDVEAGHAIVCAGAWADRLAVKAGAPAEPRIVPFRGAYLTLRPDAGTAGAPGSVERGLVRGSVYPVPDPGLPFLGAHLTRTIDGRVLLGPSALMVGARDAYLVWRVRPRDLAQTLVWPGTRRLAWRHRRAAAGELRLAVSRRRWAAAASRLVPGITAADLGPGPSGVRAQAVTRDGALIDDFVIHRTECATHVRNAPSPAATSCLALAELIADRAAES